MCDSKYKIEFETLQQMKKYVFEEKEEICVIFNKLEVLGEKILSLNVNSLSRGKAKSERERAMCNYKEGFHHDYLFHSHPILSRSYPSMEDIKKVLKSKSIMVSAVATRWGLYTIKPTSQSRRIANKWDENAHEYFSKEIRNLIDLIGIMENKIGYKNGNLRFITSDEERELQKIISSLNKLTRLEIQFCSWTSLNLPIYPINTL
jgi:hypothetical protein